MAIYLFEFANAVLERYESIYFSYLSIGNQRNGLETRYIWRVASGRSKTIGSPGRCSVRCYVIHICICMNDVTAHATNSWAAYVKTRAGKRAVIALIYA